MTQKKYTSKEYTKRILAPSSTNPWVNELASAIKVKPKTIGVIGDAKTLLNDNGQETGLHSVVGVRKPVDREEFVKIFAGGLMAVLGLGKGALDLFNTVMTVYINQKFNGEKVYLNHKVVEEYGYTKKKQSYAVALNLLINNNFLREVKGEQNHYWVNPSMFFKGDRVTLIQDFAVKGTPEGDKMEKEILDINQKKLPL